MYKYMYLRQSEPGVSIGDVIINSVYDKYLTFVHKNTLPVGCFRDKYVT